jgi:hypothetical protein
MDHLDQFVADLPPVRAWQAKLTTHTSSRLVDWLDHLVLADGDAVQGQLADLGFEPEDVEAEPNDVVYYHPGAVFPRLVLRAGSGATPGTVVAAAISVDEAISFLMAQQVAAPIEGTTLGPYRWAQVWRANEREFLVVERRGHQGFVPLEMGPSYPQRYLHAYEQWATRSRQFDDVRDGVEQTLALARSLVGDLGTDAAAWIAFAAERAYWQQRNRAGQIQKIRQDSLGLGWANHDHHAFRSSREAFPLLIQILETFGFRPRERFYAGAEAGWGAQVMEQPICHLVVFADVDLAPDEVAGDFAHQPLTSRHELGTVGLWCALHGDSILRAGLHHLACCFDFDAVTTSLAKWGIELMRPFSHFSYLRQAFTRGERWDVLSQQLERLVSAGRVDQTQRERFTEEGAIGSHLENIQRGEGFKGFNQQRVSDIIRRTDPRAGFEAG